MISRPTLISALVSAFFSQGNLAFVYPMGTAHPISPETPFNAEVPVATRLGKIRLRAQTYPKPCKPRLTRLTRLKLELCKPRLRQLLGLGL